VWYSYSFWKASSIKVYSVFIYANLIFLLYKFYQQFLIKQRHRRKLLLHLHFMHFEHIKYSLIIATRHNILRVLFNYLNGKWRHVKLLSTCSKHLKEMNVNYITQLIKSKICHRSETSGLIWAMPSIPPHLHQKSSKTTSKQIVP